MIYFDVDDLQLIVKSGDGKYDFNPECRFYQISIIKRINRLDASEIVSFLDYHFVDNQFQYSFSAIVYYYTNGSQWISDKKMKRVISVWVKKIFPLNLETIDSLFEILFDKSDLDKNSKINELTANMDLYEKVDILSFYLKIADEEMMLHRKRFKIIY